jgi:hypothetical protein
MRTVEMNLRSNELSGAMAEMRMWLDERGFEPSSFCCRDGEAGVLVRVDFIVAGEAEAFAGRFNGRIGEGAGDRGGEGRREVPSTLFALSPVGAAF